MEMILELINKTKVASDVAVTFFRFAFNIIHK